MKRTKTIEWRVQTKVYDWGDWSGPKQTFQEGVIALEDAMTVVDRPIRLIEREITERILRTPKRKAKPL